LSRAVQTLETEFEVKLFTRGPRGVTLTESGRVLYNYGKGIAAEVSRATHEMRALRDMPAGLLTVGCLRTVASTIMPEVTARFLPLHPSVRLRIVEHHNVDLVIGLQRGDLDIVIGMADGALAEAGFHYEPLFQDRLTIVARSAHPLVGRRAVTPEALKDYPWVLPRSGTSFRRRLEDMFYAAGLAPPAASIECGSLHFIRAMLIRSDYLAMIPEYSIELEKELGVLSVVPIASEFMARAVGLVLRPNHELGPAGLALVEEIRRACREYDEARRQIA
jgi:DNA-binding transcriptional LysR family regulator